MMTVVNLVFMVMILRMIQAGSGSFVRKSGERKRRSCFFGRVEFPNLNKYSTVPYKHIFIRESKPDGFKNPGAGVDPKKGPLRATLEKEAQL